MFVFAIIIYEFLDPGSYAVFLLKIPDISIRSLDKS